MLRAAIVVAACAMFSVSASAHVSGHGTLNEDEVCLTASNATTYFVTKDVGKDWGTLPQSWAEIPITHIEILAEVDGYFVSAVRNEQEEKTLYLLIAGDGAVLDANFNGAFEYVYDVEKADASSASIACQG